MSEDALLAARLLAQDPQGLGGLWLREEGLGIREEVLVELRGRLPVRPLPLSIDEDRLTGGIDIAATLAAGRPMRHTGLLVEATGSLLVLSGAERVREALTGRLAQWRDADGGSLLLIDEGGEGESAPAALTDRVAFHIVAGSSDFADGEPFDAEVASDPWSTFAALAMSLGVASDRAPLFALRAARAHAVLAGRSEIAGEDVMVALRLVLVPRATRFPEEASAPPPPEEEEQEAEQSPPESNEGRLEDVVLEAVRAILPADLIERLVASRSRSRSAGPRGSGSRKRAPARGRAVGARAGVPSGGARLALVATLRAAAPWQALRPRKTGSIALRKDDLRIRRYEDRETALTIFAVDASGSAAFSRLAEAKGAVELLLARAYARRAEVALIAFRGTGAELLLPPTRSLTRARRLLADLPGGGGTPLAAGLDAARALAESAKQKGRTPQLVVLTDGRANIAANGDQGRAAATADALVAARRIAGLGLQSVVIDIGARAQPEAAALAAAMSARMVHMPRAEMAAISAAVA